MIGVGYSIIALGWLVAVAATVAVDRGRRGRGQVLVPNAPVLSSQRSIPSPPPASAAARALAAGLPNTARVLEQMAQREARPRPAPICKRRGGAS